MNNRIFFKAIVVSAALVAGCAKQSDFDTGHKIDNYIVVLKRSQVQAVTASLSIAGNAKVSSHVVVGNMLAKVAMDHGLDEAQLVFSKALAGGVYRMSGAEAEELAEDPNVAYVEKDQIITINAVTQANATWGLDRIDQISLPLNQSYTYSEASSGAGVNAYVIDTGILTTHQQFEGRALHAADFVDSDDDATDCNGHGTHVAGTIASRTYGVAKNAKLYGVRVLDCEGSGSISGVIAGVEWVTANHIKPAVANMSLGGGASQALDEAVQASIQAGVTYVVAAGNSNVTACNSSPARVPQALTVGSTTSSDRRSDFSNYGSCVSVFAPGSDITSTWYTSNTSTNKISGTSMASPHVAGVAALYLSSNPNASPAEVKAALLASSAAGKVSDAKGSPNLLINTAFLMPSNPNPAPGPNPIPDPAPGPGPAPQPPKDNFLRNGTAVSDLTGTTKAEEKVFRVEVPSGSKNLSFTISGGRGDADMYVRFGAKPTTASYDCRPYKIGNNESCSVKLPKAGIYYVMLKTYSPYSGLSIKATFAKK